MPAKKDQFKSELDRELRNIRSLLKKYGLDILMVSLKEDTFEVYLKISSSKWRIVKREIYYWREALPEICVEFKPNFPHLFLSEEGNKRRLFAPPIILDSLNEIFKIFEDLWSKTQAYLKEK